MYDIVGLIKELFGFGKAAVEYQSKKLDLKNTEPEKQAAAAQQERDAIAKTGNAIQQKDADEIRKEIAE